MTERGMAEIIPFQIHNRTPPAEHLDRALTRLKAALAEQNAAVAAWRTQLERLRLGLGALRRSLEDQNARLGTGKQGVAELHAQACRLQAWADGVLAVEAVSPDGCR
jgi:hypothetical protein